MADPVYGEFVTLRGLISLAGLQRGQLKTVVWNKQNEQLVALGYAEIYTGTGAPPPALDPYATREWVQSQLADVEVSDADLAATVAAASATRTAVDARVRAVGDATYAPVSLRRAAKAQAVIAGIPKTQEGVQVSASPPTVTLSAAGAASSITNAVRVAPARLSSTQIDVDGDGNFAYPGIVTGKLPVSSGDMSFPDYYTGGSTFAARWRMRPRFWHTGTKFEFYFRARVATIRYRLWVNGRPVTMDMQTLSSLTVNGRYQLIVDFGSHGSRLIEAEFDFLEFGGLFIEPTGSALVGPSPLGYRLTAMGDSITAGAAADQGGITAFDAWPRWASARLGMDHENVAIGGTGYFAQSGVGAHFRNRIPDIVATNPDVLVVFGSYNDSGTNTQTEIRDEAVYVLSQLEQQLPDTIIIAVGCWNSSSGPSANLVNADNAIKEAAATVGVPFISVQDPGGVRATTPGWAASTAYAVGDLRVANGYVQKCIVAHTSTATFDQTKWRATSFVNGTGKLGATTGDGNADLYIINDGVHLTPTGAKALGGFLYERIESILHYLAVA